MEGLRVDIGKWNVRLILLEEEEMGIMEYCVTSVTFVYFFYFNCLRLRT